MAVARFARLRRAVPGQRVGLTLVSAAALCLAAAGAAAAYPVSGFTIWTIAGTGFQCQTAPACGDGGAATSAPLHFPEQLAVDSTGDVIFADSDGNEVREISPSGTISRVAGNGTACANPSACGDGGPATSAELRGPDAVAVDAAGNVYIADSGDNEIRKVSPSGTITTVAGNGTQCASISTCGNGVPATSAEFKSPEGVAVDRAGDIYIADTGDNEVRKVSPSGTITAFAGTGTACGSPPSCGDGVVATSALLTDPMGLALDGAGDLFIADTNDNEVREVSTSGTITRIAGSGTACGAPTTGCGDGTTPTLAQLNLPAAVAVDGAGNVYIADTQDNAIRKVSTTGISHVAGTGGACSAPPLCGDGGAATSAPLTQPFGVAVDSAGNVLIGDSGDSEIRWLAGPQAGPVGATGPKGATGPQGPPGPAAELVLVAFQADVAHTKVTVRYALTAAAQIKLSIKPPRGRTLVVATARGRAGLDKITWNRKLKGKRAPHGRYKLIVTATVGKRSIQSTLTVRI